jgi:LDH2 family malate/lactate/ureidoglycolate dehydrogenase
MVDSSVVSHTRLTEFITSALVAMGMARERADVTAGLMVKTDLRGVAGQPEAECERRRLREGIPISHTLLGLVNDLASDLRIPPLA